jgi:hypothetical protein
MAFCHGDQRIRKGRFEVYEEAVRVPLLIRGGGFPAGATRGKFVSNIVPRPSLIWQARPPNGIWPISVMQPPTDSAYNEIKAQLADKLEQLHRCFGLRCRTG